MSQGLRHKTTDVAAHAREMGQWRQIVRRKWRYDRSQGTLNENGLQNYVAGGFPGAREKAVRDYITRYAPKFGQDGLDDSFFWFRFPGMFQETARKLKAYSVLMYALLPICLWATLYAVDHEYEHTWVIAEKKRREEDNAHVKYPFASNRTRPIFAWGTIPFWDAMFGTPDWKKTPEELEAEGKQWPFDTSLQAGDPIDHHAAHGLKGQAPRK